MSSWDTSLGLTISSTISLKMCPYLCTATDVFSFFSLKDRQYLCTVSDDLIREQEMKVTHNIMHERITAIFMLYHQISIATCLTVIFNIKKYCCPLNIVWRTAIIDVYFILENRLNLLVNIFCSESEFLVQYLVWSRESE